MPIKGQAWCELPLALSPAAIYCNQRTIVTGVGSTSAHEVVLASVELHALLHGRMGTREACSNQTIGHAEKFPQLQKTPLPNKSSSFMGIVLEAWAGWAVGLAGSQEALGGQAVSLKARVEVWAD